MKRTVKVWMAAVMSGVLLAGGAAMTGQAPWEWRPRLIQAELMPAEDTGITRMPVGWEAIITTAEVIRHTCIPMECVPMQEAGESTQTQTRAQTKTQTQAQTQAQAPAQTQAQAPAQTQAQAQGRLRHRNRKRSGQLPGQEKLPVLRAGIRMGHTGTISARTEPV